MPFLPRFKTRRVHTDGKRFYLCDGHQLPSVTTVISSTSDQSWLLAWREKVGELKRRIESVERPQPSAPAFTLDWKNS